MRSLILSTALCILAIGGCNKKGGPVAASTCAPQAYSIAALNDLRQNGFQLTDDEERQKLAIDLVECLSDPNPKIRDGIAYEALAIWMQNKELNVETLRSLKHMLLEDIQAPSDVDGFKKPYSILILSEIARVDRLSPFLSDYDRNAFIRIASTYMRDIKDYRGFNNRTGWRYNVAYTADLLMQFTLNDRVKQAELVMIRDAVASQIRADEKHAYIHGESARLARPILFMAQRGAFTEEEWSEWIRDIAAPQPLESWDAAFKTESGLAQRHNLKQFLNAIYINITMSGDRSNALLPGVKAVLKTLP